MSGFNRIAVWGKHGAKAAAALLVLAALAACASAPKPEPPPVAAAPAPPPPSPPPIDLAGRWRLTAAAGGACFMTLGSAPGAAQGTIAPEGGCPGNFFTSRKWAFEHDTLIIRDHKGQPLAQLSFTGGHFEGQDDKGGTLSLSH
jgi:Protease inhibitor Inh